jgi:hypothetical protein
VRRHPGGGRTHLAVKTRRQWSKKFRPFVTDFGPLVKQTFLRVPWMGYFLSMTMQMSGRDIDPRR